MDSAESTSPPPDHSVAIKRLAKDLRILVYIQVAALGSLSLTNALPIMLPENPATDFLWGAMLAIGIIIYLIAAFRGVSKMMKIARRPVAIRLYLWGFWLLFLSLFLSPVLETLFDFPHWEILFIPCIVIPYVIFPFYSIIPQFFVARWLAKNAEGGTLQLSSRPPLSRRSCCLVVAICLAVPTLLLGGVVLLLCMPAPPLVISEETTRITGPLTNRGEIDFFKALEQKIYLPELVTDDNGFRDFTRLFGDVEHYLFAKSYVHPDMRNQVSEFYRLQKYEKLGLDPDIPPTLTLPLSPQEIIRNFFEAKDEEVPTDLRLLLLSSWTLEQLPMLEEWINEIDIPLDAIAEAIQKPIFFMPFAQHRRSVESGIPQTLWALPLCDIELIRDIARMFQARATFRIAQGDIDGAIDDKLTLHRFGRLISPNGTMIAYLVGVAFESTAATIPVGANPDHPLTEEQIHRILTGLDALPPRTPLNDALERDRFLALDGIQYAIRNPYNPFNISDYTTLLAEGSPLVFAIANYSCNWNIVYRRINEVFDALQEPPPRTRYHALIESIASKSIPGKLISLLTPNGRGEIVADILIDMLVPALDATEGAAHRSECTENVQRLALAILLYQLEHGELPDKNWATQIEPYLAGTPAPAAGVPANYFSCPANPSAEGFTTYALVQYDDTVAVSRDTLMLVELAKAVPLAEAVITVEEVLARKRWGNVHYYSGGMNVAHQSGAVRLLSETVEEEELLRMLGREDITRETN